MLASCPDKCALTTSLLGHTHSRTRICRVASTPSNCLAGRLFKLPHLCNPCCVLCTQVQPPAPANPLPSSRQPPQQ